MTDVIGTLLRMIASLGMLAVIPLLMHGFRSLRKTTLITAAGWAGLGIALWGIAVATTQWSACFDPGIADLLWYLAVVICLCPFIAVLGARRPGARVWGFFVVLPLVFVLLWPAIAATRVWRFGVPLELEEPALVGVVLVMVMGCGNYLGTRFTLPVLLAIGGWICVLATVSAVAPQSLRQSDLMRSLGTLLLALSLGLAGRRARCAVSGNEPWDRVWYDFVDQFGLVWGKRVMDRLNESARHEKWVTELAWHGFLWKAESSPEAIAKTQLRRDEVLRWLLKRFVDSDWIDARLKSASEVSKAKSACLRERT